VEDGKSVLHTSTILASFPSIVSDSAIYQSLALHMVLASVQLASIFTENILLCFKNWTIKENFSQHKYVLL